MNTNRDGTTSGGAMASNLRQMSYENKPWWRNPFSEIVQPSRHCFMKVQTILLLSLTITVFADEREPIGSRTSWTIATNNNQIVFHLHNDMSGSNWTLNGGPVPITLPYAYRDADSGIVFYVESDGRHVSAISPDGKLLWSRDPFADAHLPLYRTRAPRIVFIGRDRGNLAVSFSSTQSGTLDVKTGDFTYTGQD